MYSEVTYFLQCIDDYGDIPLPKIDREKFLVTLSWFKKDESLTVEFVNLHSAYLKYYKDGALNKVLDLPYISKPTEDVVNLLKTFIV